MLGRIKVKLGDITEKMIAMEPVLNSSGESFKTMVTDVLGKNNINLDHCISSSTDGASNMRGQYNGFVAHMKEQIPSHVHVWCYAHVLNLVLSDASKISTSAIKLFSVLNMLSVFFRESYKGMNLWIGQLHSSRRLTNIAETRW